MAASPISPASARHRDMLSSSREFCIAVQLYVPESSSSSSKRSPVKKRSEGRLDFLRLTGVSDDGSKRLKEQTSSLNLAKAAAGPDQWKSATCRFSEEPEGPLLSVYTTDNACVHSIRIDHLHHTDIRQADRSLFFGHRNTLGVHSLPAKPNGGPAEPVYLDFQHVDALHTWIALLRAYTAPEIYGKQLAVSKGRGDDGGLYRMWRQVDLTILEGRGLGIGGSRDGSARATPSTDDPPDLGPGDVTAAVYCEVHLAGTLSGRTTVQRGSASPTWHEAFAFTDLPRVETLRIVVCRERRTSFRSGSTAALSTVIGQTTVNLTNLKRGEAVEEWVPVLAVGEPESRTGSSDTLANGGPKAVVGQLRVRFKIDEEIVLPQSAYSSLLETIASRNALEWLRDFDIRLKLKAPSLRYHLLALACSRNVLLDNMIDGATREIESIPAAANPNTLFRGNTVFTKTMELVMTQYGTTFLESALAGPVRRLCIEKVVIETDPLRSIGGERPKPLDLKEIDRNANLLAYWCNEFWNSIYAARGECPQEMRRLFQHIRLLVEQRRPINSSPEAHRDSAWQAISAFCFLRFLVPAIISPHLFGLTPGLPDPAVGRSLMQIAKVLQTMANLNTNIERPEHMRPVKNFLSDNIPSMIDFIIACSTPSSTLANTPPVSPTDRFDRYAISGLLKQRGAEMPALAREAIPRLPLLLDLPRHLATIASSIIHHSRETEALGGRDRTGNPLPPTPLLDGLVAKCYDVENRALRRVSRLAQPRSSKSSGSGSEIQGSSGEERKPKSRPSMQRPSSANGTSASERSITFSPEPAMPSPSTRSRKISLNSSAAPQSAMPTPPPRKTRKSSRPSTAPSVASTESNSPYSRLPPSDPIFHRGIPPSRNDPPPPSFNPSFRPDGGPPSFNFPFAPTTAPPAPYPTAPRGVPVMDYPSDIPTPALTPRGGWARSSAPALHIPDGLRRPRPPPPTKSSSATKSTDSIPGLYRVRSEDPALVSEKLQLSSPPADDATKKKRGFLRILTRRS